MTDETDLEKEIERFERVFFSSEIKNGTNEGKAWKRLKEQLIAVRIRKGVL